MRLLTGYGNAKYTILPRVANMDQLGRRISMEPGIMVQSDMTQHIDTDELARINRWPAKTKKMVEERLLTHGDFGMKVVRDSRMQINGEPVNTTVFALWFAPDQDFKAVFAEHKKVIEETKWYKLWIQSGLPVGEAEEAQIRGCLFRDEGPPVLACVSPAVEGSDYCDYHGAPVEATA